MAKGDRLGSDKEKVLAAVEAAGVVDGMAVPGRVGLRWGRAHRALKALVAEGAIRRTATPMFGGAYIHVVYTAEPTLPAAASAGWPPLAVAGIALVAVLALAFIALRLGFDPSWWTDPAEQQRFTTPNRIIT